MSTNYLEKKWFVYLQKRQEGPFSIEELRAKLQTTQISTATFVWSEGMKDWVPLHEALPELGGVTLDVENLERPPAMEPYRSREVLKKKQPRRLALKISLGLLTILLTLGVVLFAFRDKPGVRKLLSRTERSLAPYLASLADKNPYILAFVSDIPDLPNVLPSDLELLRKASLAQFGKAETTIALVSTENSDHRTLYLASGRPDGTRFEIRLNGVAATLLDSLSASTTATAVIENHFCLIEITVPLPAGDYVVSVLPIPESQGGAAESAPPLLSEKFFIGEKNAAYSQGLRDFHEKIRAQAAQELAELRKAARSMETMLLPNPKHPEPNLLKSRNGELNAYITRWSSPDFQKTVFYGTLFQLAQQVSQAVAQYNDLQDHASSKKSDGHSLEIRIGEALSVAKNAVISLESKIDFAERASGPGGPGGMGDLPEREGL
jgi:hypothetical protein